MYTIPFLFLVELPILAVLQAQHHFLTAISKYISYFSWEYLFLQLLKIFPVAFYLLWEATKTNTLASSKYLADRDWWCSKSNNVHVYWHKHTKHQMKSCISNASVIKKDGTAPCQATKILKLQHKIPSQETMGQLQCLLYSKDERTMGN